MIVFKSDEKDLSAFEPLDGDESTGAFFSSFFEQFMPGIVLMLIYLFQIKDSSFLTWTMESDHENTTDWINKKE